MTTQQDHYEDCIELAMAQDGAQVIGSPAFFAACERYGVKPADLEDTIIDAMVGANEVREYGR